MNNRFIGGFQWFVVLHHEEKSQYVNTSVC
nr:MAG TPA: hypothetical protein [Caudoviricetes sp.]